VHAGGNDRSPLAGLSGLLLSILFLSSRIVPLRFYAGGCRRRPNLGLVCCLFCVISKIYSGGLV